MGLRAALQGLVSKHDEGRFALPAARCRDDNRQLPRAYGDFDTPKAEMGHDLRTGVHLGEARVYRIHTEIRPKVKTFSPPASATRRNTALTDSSMARRPGTDTLHAENRYSLAEVAARMAFANRYGNCGARDRVVPIPPTPPTRAESVVVVERKPLPGESKAVRGRRTASNTAPHEALIEKPPDVVSEEASGTNPASPVCKPTKRRRKGEKGTVATSHLARGSMRSETEHVDAT
ncbi:hypothetical protein LY76DRAFT_638023 [Colletotrichum caudatum]|nr:hypothetical protein LY76DRAFT_638023 [Colletotrichum caudatum]